MWGKATSRPHDLTASIATDNGITSGEDLVFGSQYVITFASSHFLNTALKSLGTPFSTTVLIGTKGLSSIEAARIPYSWANIKAVWNSAYFD
jgi:hypothetical protein